MKKSLIVIICLIVLNIPCYAGIKDVLRDCKDLVMSDLGLTDSLLIENAAKKIKDNSNGTFVLNNEYIRISDLENELNLKIKSVHTNYNNYLKELNPNLDNHEFVLNNLQKQLQYLLIVQNNLINAKIYNPVYKEYRNLNVLNKYDSFEQKKRFEYFKELVNNEDKESNIAKVDNLLTKEIKNINTYINNIEKISGCLKYDSYGFHFKDAIFRKAVFLTGEDIRKNIEDCNNNSDKEKTFLTYYESVKERVDYLNEIIANHNIYPTNSNEILEEYGYAVKHSEGSYYVYYPYTTMTTAVKNVPENWMEWLYILQKRENDIEDAALNISVDELRLSIISIDNFMKKYPDFINIEEVKNNLDYRIYWYLEGLDNSKPYDRETMLIKSEYKKSYEKFIEENKDCSCYDKVLTNYEKLKKNNFKYIE